MNRPSFPNPLAVAFGAALRLAREDQRKPTKAIANAANITDSFYRLIESGRNHLSISKAPHLFHAFDKSLNYEALVLFISTIAGSEETSHVQPDRKVRRGNVIQMNTQAIFESLPNGHPFRIFLSKALAPLAAHSIPSALLPKSKPDVSLLQLANFNSHTVRDIVAHAQFDKEAYEVLKTYADYRPSHRRVHEDYLKGFFRNIPTLYKPMLDDIKQSIVQYPRIFAPETSWDWERKAQSKFEQLFALCSHQYLITSVKNLQRYNFSYLWLKSFRKADFFVLDDPPEKPEELQTLFWKNLQAALGSSSAESQKLLKGLTADVLAKTHFSGCPLEQDRIRLQTLLQSLAEDEPQFNAMWFYKTIDGAIIGAASHIEHDTVKATRVKFLTFDECARALDVIEKIKPVL